MSNYPVAQSIGSIKTILETDIKGILEKPKELVPLKGLDKWYDFFQGEGLEVKNKVNTSQKVLFDSTTSNDLWKGIAPDNSTVVKMSGNTKGFLDIGKEVKPPYSMIFAFRRDLKMGASHLFTQYVSGTSGGYASISITSSSAYKHPYLLVDWATTEGNQHRISVINLPYDHHQFNQEWWLLGWVVDTNNIVSIYLNGYKITEFYFTGMKYPLKGTKRLASGLIGSQPNLNGDFALFMEYTRTINADEMYQIAKLYENRLNIEVLHERERIKLIHDKGLPASLCRIPTYEHVGKTVHPSVIGDAELKLKGHYYWMANTPWGGSPESEDPCIYYSDDGINWFEPEGLTNPIAPHPAEGLNTDTELIYDKTSGKFYCYYRLGVPDARVVIYRKESLDGVVWTNEVEVMRMETGGGSHAKLLSPSIRIINKVWYMYVADQTAGYIMTRYESSDGVVWTNPTLCNGMTEKIWHLDVDYHEGLKKYFLFFSEREGKGEIYLYTSQNGIDFTKVKMLIPTLGIDDKYMPIYKFNLYRPSVMLHKGGSGAKDFYRIWFGILGLNQNATSVLDMMLDDDYTIRQII